MLKKHRVRGLLEKDLGIGREILRDYELKV